MGLEWTAHDVLWVAAETGLPVAAAVTGLLVVFGLRAWRAAPAARLLWFAIIPFWIDDLVLTGIYLGMIDRYTAAR